MIISACMGLMQRIGGGCEILYSYVKDCKGYRAIPQADSAEIEKLPDPSNIYLYRVFSFTATHI
jgi:hypothetical protein